MKEKTMFFLGILSFILSFSVYSQNVYEDLVPSRLAFTTTKPQNFSGEVVKLESDTLFEKKHTNKNLNFLRSSQYDNKKMIKQYRQIVFGYTCIYPEKNYYLSQWNNDIVIYLDPQLHKKVRDRFEEFYSGESLKNIKNLKISFTRKLKNATYHIKATKEDINGYGKDYKFDTEADRKNNLLTGITYTLQADRNHKFYAGTLYVNPKKIGSNTLVLKRLKQVFYKSLGSFTGCNYKDKNSLLHGEYDNSEHISPFDLNILKLQYAIIFDQLVDHTTHLKLIKLATKDD